ncbi:Separase [Zea mays]|nr:Separase [Zea mays]
MVIQVRRKNSGNAEAGPPLDAKARRSSRNSSRLAKGQNVETLAKTRTRSSKRNACMKSEKVLTELNSKNNVTGSKELAADASVCGEAECFPDGIDHSKDDLCNMFGCWSCLFIKSLNSGCIQNILQLRLDYVHRHYLVSLLLKKARALGSHSNGDCEVHSVYWKCISLLFFRSLPQDCCRTYGPYLIGLIMDRSIGDFLPLECAEILFNMSFFLLKSPLSEQSRDICCIFSSVTMADVVPWLLKAFVLSRESPSLVQEVCKLLACIFLLSTTDSSIQLPLGSHKESLSLNHWATYFHQVSVGTNLNCHYFASLQASSEEKVPKDTYKDFRNETDDNVSKFLRLSSRDIKYIEKHMTEFFQKLPDVPVLCISMLGGDYVNALLKFHCHPPFFPAWMLLSRFDSTNEPTTLLLPVDSISEMQFEDSCTKDLGNPTRVLDKWQCPWGYGITDYVAPVFRNILEENFMSLSSATLTIDDVNADRVRWWSHRMKLNNYLANTLKDIEDSWFGPWKCLLLGHQLSDEHIETASSMIITGLDTEFEFEVNPMLIKAILGGAVSVDEVQECFLQLILYKGYFGRGGCCGKDRLKAFSSCQMDDGSMETLKRIITDASYELPQPADRDPVILVLDVNVQMLPWENLPVLRNQEIYRMPSMGSIFLALSRTNNDYKDHSSPFPVIDPFNTYYLLNPSGDLSSTQEEFVQLFRNYEWKGVAGNSPKADELVLALTNHDLFLYFGHGSGTQYISSKEVEKIDNCAAALLMGCSSGTLHCKGSYAPRGAPLSYLFAGSPAIIANLWDVSDKDIDRFSKALLNSWLHDKSLDGNNCSKCCQLTMELESMSIASKENGKARRQGTRGKKQQHINDSTKCCSCKQRRIASYISEARRACRLPLLIGASPVCYGVPTIIRKKVMTDSTTREMT